MKDFEFPTIFAEISKDGWKFARGFMVVIKELYTVYMHVENSRSSWIVCSLGAKFIFLASDKLFVGTFLLGSFDSPMV